MEAVALLALLPLLASCAPAPEPVGRLTVEPARVELPYPRFADLQLRFEPTAPLEGLVGEPLVFVHVLEGPGSVIRTFDHDLPAAWTPGEPIEYTAPIYQSALGPPLRAGSYAVSAGIYDMEGHRWPLTVDGNEVDFGEYAIAELTVAEAAGEEPMFYFSAAWGALEGGTDGQILGRRSLAGPGEIRVGPLTRPGVVWMQVRVPPVEGKGLRLELEPGAERPAILVRSDCSDVEMWASGSGSHELEVPVSPPETGDGECRITIEPNYRVVEVATLMERVLTLDILAWRPQAERPVG